MAQYPAALRVSLYFCQHIAELVRPACILRMEGLKAALVLPDHTTSSNILKRCSCFRAMQVKVQYKSKRTICLFIQVFFRKSLVPTTKMNKFCLRVDL